MSLLKIDRLCVKYGQSEVLHDVSVTLDPGEIVTVLGPNGSGKSTLLRAIVGAVEPAHGSITRMPGLKIGYVPQRLHIDPSLPMTVARFLALPGRMPKSAIAEALSQADVPDLANRQMSKLSGGQFQRVLLARALIGNPEVLLLDEATQGLDQPGSAAFYKRIEEVRDALGCAILMVSHELHVVMSASDRVICLNGHVCCHGTPEVVASAPEYRQLFGTGTEGTFALYRHQHDHDHDHDPEHHHDHTH